MIQPTEAKPLVIACAKYSIFYICLDSPRGAINIRFMIKSTVESMINFGYTIIV